MSLISIVVTLYNSRDTIEYCISSVINQTYSNFEIILVDDGSDEKYEDILKSFNDKRISYYKLSHSNANVARNYGIEKSKGEYVAMLDSDDLWLPNHLEDCISTMRQEKADGLYGSLIIKNGITGNGKEFKVRALYDDEVMVNYLLKTGCGAQTSSLFMSVESAKQIKWDETLKRHQDYDFVIRYSQSYLLRPKLLTTVIHVISERKKNIDLGSCIRVIEKNKKDIDPFLYNQYNQGMLNLSQQMKAPEEIIKHYTMESIKFLEYIPYSKYISIINPRNRWKQFKCKMRYIFYILKIVVVD